MSQGEIMSKKWKIADIRNIKYVVVLLLMSIFAASLLKNAEVLGDVDQQMIPTVQQDLNESFTHSTDIICQENHITGIEIFLQVNDRVCDGEMEVSLLEDGKLIQEWKGLNRRTISRADTTFFELENPMVGCKGRVLTLEVTSTGGTGLALGMTTDGDNNQEIGYRLISDFISKKTVGIVAIICAILLMIGFAVLSAKQTKVENIFAYIYVVMALMSIVAIPMFKTPDEQTHYLRSYEISQGWMMSEHLENGSMIGALDGAGREMTSNLLPYHQDKSISLFDVADAMDVELDESSTTVYGFANTALYAPTSYLPQVIGIKIASLFTNRTMILAYAGRFVNMLCIGIILFFAIRFVPVGKSLIAMISLIPSNLQAFNSLSADGFAYACTIMLVAYVLYMRFKKTGVMSRWQLALMYVITILLCLCKVVYVPMVLLLFLIPKERFKDKKTYWINVVISGAVIIVTSVGWLALATGFVGEIRPGVDILAQMKLILTEPAEFILTFMKSIELNGLNYFMGMFGSLLGWLDIPINTTLILIFFIILLTQVTLDNDIMGIDFNNVVRGVLLGASLITFMLIFVTLYGQWTAVGYPYIDGVQGRYFLPILFPVLLALKPKANRFAKKPGIQWNGYLGILAIDYCVMLTLTIRALITI